VDPAIPGPRARDRGDLISGVVMRQPVQPRLPTVRGLAKAFVEVAQRLAGGQETGAGGAPRPGGDSIGAQDHFALTASGSGRCASNASSVTA
jgi:hypothetical protein